MLPQFPQFKKLELSDKNDIEKITSQYPPYSDFNFTSMWSWDIKEEMRISQLNDNLVARFSDYLTGKPFYSFLGSNKTNETAEALLELSKKERLMAQLKLIPEEIATGLSESKFFVKEDIDNFDYIYTIEDLKNFSDRKFQSKRRARRHFLQAYPNVTIKFIDLSDIKIQEKLLNLYEKWVEFKIKKKKNVDARNETAALKKFFLICKQSNFLVNGVFVNETLVGCSVIESLNSEYTISHFLKADNNYEGIHSFIMQEEMKIISDTMQNKIFFNFEQDLGISGLRASKTSLNPKCFLKKFTIAEKTFLKQISIFF